MTNDYITRRWTVIGFLSIWFRIPERLLDCMHSTGTLVCGQNVTQFFHECVNPEYPLDLCVKPEHIFTVAQILFEDGYRFQPPHGMEAAFDDALSAVIDSYRSTGMSREAELSVDPSQHGAHFFRFRRETAGQDGEHTQILIRLVRCEPYRHILSQHSTAFMDFITADYAISPFAHSSLISHLSFLVRGNHIFDQEATVIEGWHYFDMPRPECQYYNPQAHCNGVWHREEIHGRRTLSLDTYQYFTRYKLIPFLFHSPLAEEYRIRFSTDVMKGKAIRHGPRFEVLDFCSGSRSPNAYLLIGEPLVLRMQNTPHSRNPIPDGLSLVVGRRKHRQGLAGVHLLQEHRGVHGNMKIPEEPWTYHMLNYRSKYASPMANDERSQWVQCVLLPTGHHHARLVWVKLDPVRETLDVTDFFPNGALSIHLAVLQHEGIPTPEPYRVYIGDYSAPAPVNRSVDVLFNLPWNGNILIAGHALCPRKGTDIFGQSHPNPNAFRDVNAHSGKWGVCMVGLWLRGLFRSGLFNTLHVIHQKQTAQYSHERDHRDGTKWTLLWTSLEASSRAFIALFFIIDPVAHDAAFSVSVANLLESEGSESGSASVTADTEISIAYLPTLLLSLPPFPPPLKVNSRLGQQNRKGALGSASTSLLANAGGDLRKTLLKAEQAKSSRKARGQFGVSPATSRLQSRGPVEEEVRPEPTPVDLADRIRPGDARQNPRRYIFFTNMMFYVWIRYLIVMASRLSEFKDLSAMIAAHDPKTRRPNSGSTKAPIAADNVLNTLNPTETLSTTLSTSSCWTRLKPCSAMTLSSMRLRTRCARCLVFSMPSRIFTVDKVCGAIVKQMQIIQTEKKNEELLEIMRKERSLVLPTTQDLKNNRRNAEKVLGPDENMFRMDCVWLHHDLILHFLRLNAWVPQLADTKTVTIQLIDKDDSRFDDSEVSTSRWQFYIDSFVSMCTPRHIGMRSSLTHSQADVMSGISPSKVKPPFLKRNVPASVKKTQPYVLSRRSLEIKVYETGSYFKRLKKKEEMRREWLKKPEQEPVVPAPPPLDLASAGPLRYTISRSFELPLQFPPRY
ncbi:hypothetical protein NMY22_g6425 [Coprinellus aureogranulatus]|nr:hypothetical protein NMY22_g6425 [Coprinellus aureogranulatus]